MQQQIIIELHLITIHTIGASKNAIQTYNRPRIEVIKMQFSKTLTIQLKSVTGHLKKKKRPWSNIYFFTLTLPAPCITKTCAKIKINLNFYFHTSLWSSLCL